MREYEIRNVTPSPKIIRPDVAGKGAALVLPIGAKTRAREADIEGYSRDVLTLAANRKIKVTPIK